MDIPPGEDPAGSAGGQQQAPQGQRSLKARGKGMMSMLGRKMQKEDPLKELTSLGYHEDDCRVRIMLFCICLTCSEGYAAQCLRCLDHR